MSPASERKFFRREELEGKEVYDLEAKRIGRVADIGISPSGKLGLVVEVEKGRTEFFEFESVQAIGDIVLIRSGTATRCPNCGSPVRPGSAFCTKCGAKL
jgi:sporulation protein YlmC with PRC-barrel domain